MEWIGARPYECDRAHWFAVTELPAPPRQCPVCGSHSVRYMGDGDVPIFVLQVEDIWEMTSDADDEEAYPFRELSVEDCIDLGGDLETPWEAVEVLAETALEAKSSAA